MIQTLIGSMEKCLHEENYRARGLLSEISFKFKTDRTRVILRDLTTRQMINKIFEYLKNPVRFQILNKRFYEGIHPHWFSQIQRVNIRHTETEGVSHPNLVDFEFPTLDYVEDLTPVQKKSLMIQGVSWSTDDKGRCNILLSNGEQSKVADWQSQITT